ncbi:hypothetical protein M3Y99_01416900 [Aphelenchoides fujianensis]|nr:hypothetical protein M3Y99_01416900 [Aphelenchoides fujianensis]
MSTEAWTGVAGSMLLAASAAAFPAQLLRSAATPRPARGAALAGHFGGEAAEDAVRRRRHDARQPLAADGPLGAVGGARLLDRLPADETERMCGVAAFVLSGYSALVGRKRKPFNPLLGETFDFVAHHPAVSACHAEGDGWTWWQTLEGTTAPAFDGSVSATPLHPVRLRLANGEEYSWNKVTTIIQNARAEADKRVVRNEGEMVIRSSTGVECRLQFAVEGNAVEGRVRGRAGERAVRLLGQIVASGEQVALFEAPPPHEHAAAHYGFNRFTMALNELHAAERPLLPPTDSRFRPDQRLLENGEPERAEEAKKRLEKEQRGRSALAHRPLWFERERDAFTGRSLWLSNGRYWPAKEARFEDPHSRRMVALFSTDDSQ